MTPNALLLGLVFLTGFRIALNVVNGNVIDVGYAGVIGGDRILHGEALYGGFPAGQRARRHVRAARVRGLRALRARVPVERRLGRSSGCARRRGGVRSRVRRRACGSPGDDLAGATLGLLLAYLWVACPFTLLVVNSGTNDALVRRARARGVPLPRPAGRPRRARRRGRPDEVRAAGARAVVRDVRPRAAAQRRRSGGDRRAGPGSRGARSGPRPLLGPHARLPGRARRRRSRSGVSTAGSTGSRRR